MKTIQERQPVVYQTLFNALKHHALSHAYLFVGESGTGKQSTANWLASSFLCQDSTTPVACGNCSSCKRIHDHQHPDVHHLLPEGQSIKVNQMLAIKSHLGKSGMESAKQVLIVHQTERLTTAAANSLLKFIEEPEGELLVVFFTSNRQSVLPTIQSRCQVVYFQQIPSDELMSQFMSEGMLKKHAVLLAEIVNSIEQGLALYQEEWFEETVTIMEKWADYLSKRDPYAFVYVQQKIVPVFKDKTQQSWLFTCLTAHIKQTFLTQISTLSQEEEYFFVKLQNSALEATKKWQANVSFQNVCEQLAAKITK